MISENYHAEEKMKCPFQTAYNCNWIKFSCYSSDKVFGKIGEVNILRGKSEIIFKENPLIKALLHFFKHLGTGLSPQIANIFKFFGAQSFLMVT